MRLQPAIGRDVGQRNGLEDFTVDLRLHGQCIAPIDEEHGLPPQDDRKPGRTGEAREPCEPFLRGRDIFILMAVRAGDQITIDLIFTEGGA